MALLTVVESARGLFASGPKTLTFTRPAAAITGDVLLAIVAFDSGDSMNTPSGWTQILTAGSLDRFLLLVRMVDDGDPASIVFPVLTAGEEWQAELVVFRPTSPGVIRYAGNISTFTSQTALVTPGVTVQQAIDLVLSAWSCSGALTLTAPSGFTTIDKFSTSVVSSRSLMVAYRLAGATGALTFGNGVSNASTTGAAITQALRAHPPLLPARLEDIVPGNIGLIGKDTRPAR